MKIMWISLAWITTMFVAAGTVLGVKYMNVTLKSPPPQVRVDTIRSVVYDTVTVISRAKDTVRVTDVKVGPLTQARLVSIVCGKKYDPKDEFSHNPVFGFVICLNRRSEK